MWNKIDIGSVLKQRVSCSYHADGSVNYAGWMTCQHHSHGFPAHGRCSRYPRAVSIAAFICSSSCAVTPRQVLKPHLQKHGSFRERWKHTASEHTHALTRTCNNCFIGHNEGGDHFLTKKYKLKTFLDITLYFAYSFDWGLKRYLLVLITDHVLLEFGQSR